MGKYSQQDRAFRISVPSLDEDTLLLEGFSGEEHVSEPFDFKLEMVSENDSIAAADVLREPFVLLIRLPDGSDRHIHGICVQFGQHGKDEGLTSYEARMVPWLHLLSLNRDCRIFQEKTVLEIIEEVFSRYDLADYEVKCLGSYSPREYCVQYRESDLNFVSRLMEEEGIFYFFEHSEGGHKLILADDSSAIQECQGQDYFRVAATADARQNEDVITDLEREYQVYTNKVTLTDYDPLHPSLDLESSASDDDHEEVYDYPGRYAELSEGERYASLLLEERAAGHDVARGLGRCRAFRSGYKFELSEHYRKDFNQAFLLLSVWHSGHSGGYRTSEAQTEYSNHFVCIPASVPFRPPRRAPKPVIHGSQTAVVVGPSGEEVYTDKHGRIKVQFHWDREGQKDENSSCWIRVASPWAGKGYGSVSIPRIGNEVVVDFLEGDPDRPLVMSSVYNAEQAPPFQLPGSGIQMGMKSRSSPGGGGDNEITMTDTAGKEMMNIHAQYDQVTTVGNDQTNTINNNRTTSVSVDDTESVGSNQSIEVGSNQKTTIGADRSLSVGGNDTNSVSGNQENGIGGNRTGDVGGNESLSVGSNRDISVSGNHSLDAGGNVLIKAGAEITLEAGAKIVLTVGGTTITLTPGSLESSSPAITTTAAASHDIKGAVVKHNC